MVLLTHGLIHAYCYKILLFKLIFVLSVIFFDINLLKLNLIFKTKYVYDLGGAMGLSMVMGSIPTCQK